MIALALLALNGCAPDCDAPGTICTVAGTGLPGLLTPEVRPALEEQLYWPADVTIAPDGTPWIVDWNNHRILTLEADRGGDYLVHEVTGHGLIGDPIAAPLESALWNHPTGLIFRDDGAVIVAAWHNSKVIGLDLVGGTVFHIAGDGTRSYGGDDGPAADASFDLVSSVAYGADGLLYLSDQANQRVRCIDDGEIVRTVVGNGERAFAGDGGPALEASLRAEVSQNADPGGKIAIADGKMYIADTLNGRVRVVDMDTWIIDTFAGGSFGDGDNGDPLAAALTNPRDVAIGPDGSVYIADTQNSCVRRVSDGVISTVAGICREFGYDGDGGPATEALLERPLGIDVGPDGALWIADTWNSVVRRVAPAE